MLLGRVGATGGIWPRRSMADEGARSAAFSMSAAVSDSGPVIYSPPVTEDPRGELTTRPPARYSVFRH